MTIRTGSSKIFDAAKTLSAETVRQSALTTLDVAMRSTDVIRTGANTVSQGIVRAGSDIGSGAIREIVNYTPDIYDVGRKGNSDLSTEGAMFAVGNTAMVARAGVKMVSPVAGSALQSLNNVIYSDSRLDRFKNKTKAGLSYSEILTGYSVKKPEGYLSRLAPFQHNANAMYKAGVRAKAGAAWTRFQSSKYDRMVARKKKMDVLSEGLKKNGFSMSRSMGATLSNQSRKVLNSITRGNDPNGFANQTMFVAQKSIYTAIRQRARIKKLLYNASRSSWYLLRHPLKSIKNVTKIISGFISGILSVITSIPVVVSTAAMIIPFVVIVAVVATIVTSILGAWHIDYTSRMNFQAMNLSEAVLEWEPTVRAWCQSNWDEQYVPLVLAIIQVESGGNACDLMQSSESHGGGAPGTGCGVYSDKRESLVGSSRITGGIQALKYCCELAGVTSSTDMENIKLACQGYNYGTNYIRWARTNYGGYSKQNAQTYACMYGGSSCSYGNSAYVERVMQYYYVGGTGTISGVPDWSNMNAWGSGNIYYPTWAGQCTYYALGMVIQTYGQPTGGYTNYWFCQCGNQNVYELVTYHPEKWRYSSYPSVGAVCSTMGNMHVMFVIGWDGHTMTVFEGNMDGMNNYDWASIKADCRVYQYTLDQLYAWYGNYAFAVPIGD